MEGKNSKVMIWAIVGVLLLSLAYVIAKASSSGTSLGVFSSSSSSTSTLDKFWGAAGSFLGNLGKSIWPSSTSSSTATNVSDKSTVSV